MSDRQSGIVAFLFTDVEGSTRLWEADPRAMSAALARHDSLLSDTIASSGGAVFKTAGDAFCAVFPTPATAIHAAVACQRALAVDTAMPGPSLKVRMAMHAGHAEVRDGDYFGPALNRVARLLSIAHGGQIVVSRAVQELARDDLPSELTLRDLGEYALKDLQHPERVFQVVAPDLPADFPPLRTPAQRLRNVPAPTTPLIGREREVSRARALLGLAAPADPGPSTDRAPSQARLLTLTGPGGAGKTRLALHLATELGPEFSDGAAFVPLAAITDPTLIAGAIVDALDPDGSRGEAAGGRLVELLANQHLLLILDNFEQVISAAPLVADLLSRCPRLCIIATSRERLNLRGEQDLALPPLALPRLLPAHPAGSGPTVDLSHALAEMRRSEAVQLFLARARFVHPDFDITADNASAIGEICHRLDGLPLAIELAAARVRTLSPQALLDRFDRRLDVLSRGPRDLPERHQTMRATIAWSFDLLAPVEQQLFARLSVFVGGATLAACAAIAAETAEQDGWHDIEALESLADKSLIQLAADDPPRMSMLETIRDFGLERLAESAELPAIGKRHAEFFLRLAEAAEPLLEGSEQTVWLDRLEHDQANLRAAIGWWRDHGYLDEALRLASALWRFWWLRGDMVEGRRQLDTLLAESGGVSPTLRAKALNGAGVLAESQSDWETAARLHEESLALSRGLGDPRGVAWSLNNLGVVEINQGDLGRAQSLLAECLAVAEQSGDAASIASALTDLGQIAHYQGDLERAAVLWARALAYFRDLGDKSSVARVLNNLGAVALYQHEYERAQSLLAESLELHRGVGDRQGIASTLNNLAPAAAGLQDTETAKRLYLESYTLALEAGNRLHAAIALDNLASLLRQNGDEREARDRFREALLLYCQVGDQEGMVSCLRGLASALIHQGCASEAAVLLGAACGIHGQSDQPLPSTMQENLDALRAELGETAFGAAWETGRSLPVDDLIDRVAHNRHLAPLHLVT
jgi:predicted ATPase/class 3 adenylate cyclase